MRSAHTPARFIVFFVASIFAGLLTANLQRDVLSKPFSFCLPGHRDLSRRLPLAIGSVLGLLTGVAFLATFFFSSHGLGLGTAPLPFWAIFFLAMMCYLLGVWFVFAPKDSAAFVCGVLLVISAVLARELTLRLINYMIVSAPLLPISAGIATCVIAWKWLGDDSLARRHCGESYISIADIGNTAKIEKLAQKRALKKRSDDNSALTNRLEGFFLEKMTNAAPLSMNRYMLGNLYNMFATFLWPWRKSHLLIVVALIPHFGYLSGAIVGYTDGRSGWDLGNILFLAPSVAAVQMDLISHRNFLLPAGRMERYNGALGTGAFMVILTTLAVALLAALSVPLNSVLPDIVVRGHTFTCQPIHARGFYISLFLVPIALTIGTLFSGKNWPRTAFMVFVMMLMQLWINPGLRGISERLPTLGVPGIVILIAISWAGSALLLRYHCRKHDLVGQGR